MRLAIPVLVACAGCAFPMGPGGTASGYFGGFATGGEASPGMLMVAYQATGERDGKAAETSRVVMNFGLTQEGVDVVESDDCVGLRVRDVAATGGLKFPANDAGTFSIGGGKSPYTCANANGEYRCDVPTEGLFFEPGAALSFRRNADARRSAYTVTNLVAPRAPEPSVDLSTLHAQSGDVRVSWKPSSTAIPMTCLQLETLNAAGQTTGYVQCDVDDSEGEARVPANVAAVLDRSAPVSRAALFSVDGTELWVDGAPSAIYFGQGRFVEYRK